MKYTTLHYYVTIHRFSKNLSLSRTIYKCNLCQRINKLLFCVKISIWNGHMTILTSPNNLAYHWRLNVHVNILKKYFFCKHFVCPRQNDKLLLMPVWWYIWMGIFQSALLAGKLSSIWPVHEKWKYNYAQNEENRNSFSAGFPFK